MFLLYPIIETSKITLFSQTIQQPMKEQFQAVFNHVSKVVVCSMLTDIMGIKKLNINALWIILSLNFTDDS